MGVSYQLGEDAAIVRDYKGANQAVVKGLGKLSLPGLTRETVTVDEFRNEFARQFAGSGKYNDITFGGNYVTGDTDGQDQLKLDCYNRTRLRGPDLMCYLNMNDFFTTDLANDPDSAMQIASMEGGEADKNGVFPLSGKIVPNGRLAIYVAHLIEGATPTLAFDTTGGDKITDSGNSFVTAGFKVGQTILIIGSTSNDSVAALVTAVAAGQLDLDVKVGALSAESGVTGMEVHGGGL
jgi:hypothetical protein